MAIEKNGAVTVKPPKLKNKPYKSGKFYRIKRGISKFFTYFAVIFLACLFFFPFMYMLLSSFQPTSSDLFVWPVKWIPDTFRFRNYVDAFVTMDFMRAFFNTLFIMITANALQIASSILVAYGFARFKNKYTEIFFWILLSTMMLPWIVTMVPSFVLYKFYGWIGTRLPLILPAISGSAFNIYMLRNFMRGIPKSLDEAAEIDGCNSFFILVKILAPNMTPIIVTMVVFACTGTWGDYVGPSIYLLKQELYTLSLSFDRFKDLSGAMEWNKVMAGCVLYTVPMMILLFSAQNVFMRGIVTTAVKE